MTGRLPVLTGVLVAVVVVVVVAIDDDDDAGKDIADLLIK